MKFSGFPDRVRSVPAPAPLFGPLLEQIDDIGELKCVLRVLWLLQRKRGYPRFVTLREALGDRTLAVAVGGGRDGILRALDACVRRGTLAMAVVERDGEEDRLYALNTDRDRLALSRVTSDAFVVGYTEGLSYADPSDAEVERSNVFALYEANIGMLSPMVADELREAEALYPMEWIEGAFREAVAHNARNWRYIARILENWERDGRSRGQGDGKSRRYSKKVKRY